MAPFGLRLTTLRSFKTCQLSVVLFPPSGRHGMDESRKLAAILVADVVGFSRPAGADEDRTLARLRALRSDLIDPTIAVYKGRVVKRTGYPVIHASASLSSPLS